MNQFPAALNFQSSLLDGAARADDWAFAKPNGVLLQKITTSRLQTISRKIYGLRGVALHPWVNVSDLPEQVESQQARDAQVERAVEDAIAAERNRLARELHDAVAQTSLRCELDCRSTARPMGHG